MRITTTSNFIFIQEKFIEAKIAAKKELQSGVVNPHRIHGVGLEGASRTGKSWDICVFLCHYISQYNGKQVNICRDHRAKLIKTFYATLKKVWINYFKFPSHHFNKTGSDIYVNGNVIRFVGINDDIYTAHGLESDLLIINEAIAVDINTINQMEQRTTEFYIYDYNPREVESGVYDKEILPSYRLHKTTIFDNPYAPSNSKAKILSYAHLDVNDEHIAVKAGYSPDEWQKLKEVNHELKTAHKYNWDVYGLGKRAVGQDIIFPDWKEYQNEPSNNTLDWEHVGGDFGFKSDPTAAIKVKKSGNSIYIRELFYEQGLLNNDIAEKMKKHKEEMNLSIWDKSEEKSIHEMRALNINATWADKGPGSISYGIQKMHQFHIFIHKDSENVQREFMKYRWAKQKDGSYKRNSFGKRIPVDKNNHAIDAIRYVILYYFRETIDDSSLHD